MANQALKLLKELRNAIDEITIVGATSGKRTNAKDNETDLNESIGYTLEKVDNFLSERHEIQIIQVACPQCHTEYEIEENLAGRKAVCQNCGGEFSAEPAQTKPFTKTVLFNDSDTIQLIKAAYQQQQKKWWEFWK